MTADLLAMAPRLRAIARTGVGYDLIDLAAASSHRVAVTITPGTNQESVAEQTLALILALARRIVPNDRVIHVGGWDRTLVAPVRGMTLGLIGMGRIGRAVAMRAQAFRMRVVAFDTMLDADFDRQHGIERMPVDELLACSDMVSLHLPLTDATRGMVDRQFLARMRPGSYLINTSRGGLVVETDLRDALASGHLAGAGLDVLNHEPPEPGNPLLGLPNVVISPHIAGTDLRSMADMAEMAAADDRRALAQSMAGGLRRQRGTARRMDVVRPPDARREIAKWTETHRTPSGVAVGLVFPIGMSGRGESSSACRDQTWKELPQPQLLTTFGLLKTNPRFSRPS